MEYAVDSHSGFVSACGLAKRFSSTEINDEELRFVLQSLMTFFDRKFVPSEYTTWSDEKREDFYNRNLLVHAYLLPDNRIMLEPMERTGDTGSYMSASRGCKYLPKDVSFNRFRKALSAAFADSVASQ